MEFLIPAIITAVATIAAAVMSKSRPQQIIIQQVADAKGVAEEDTGKGNGSGFFYFLVIALGIVLLSLILWKAIQGNTAGSGEKKQRINYSLEPKLTYKHHFFRRFKKEEEIITYYGDRWYLEDFTTDANNELVAMYSDNQSKKSKRIIIRATAFPIAKIKELIKQHFIYRIKRFNEEWIILYDEQAGNLDQYMLVGPTENEKKNWFDQNYRTEHIVWDATAGWVSILLRNNKIGPWSSWATQSFNAEYLNKKWNEDKDLYKLEYSNGIWTYVFLSDEYLNWSKNAIIIHRDNFPANEIYEKEKEGYLIRNLNFASNQWHVHFQ